MSDDERGVDDGRSEAQVRMEQDMKRRKEKAAEEMAEYEEMRREQREKEAQEIQELRERRQQRKQVRAEEEKRHAELRAQEDQKKRAEDEERQRKKKEEEAKKKEEREAKRKEHEERIKKSGPNFTISKKSSEGDAKPEEDGAEKKPTKSKEQLEAERKAEMEKRFHKVDTSGLGVDALKEKAKELHHILYKLESEKYDLMKRFEQQNYDMQELAERARQISKGGGKKNVNVSATPDPLAAKFSGVPPKVTMYSQYERVKDHRSFGERSNVFTGPLYSEEYQKIEPTHKVVMTEMGAKYVDGAGENGHSVAE